VNQLNQYIEAITAFARKHAFMVELAAYALLAVGTAVWVGRAAYTQAAALSEQGKQLEAMRKGADVWITNLQPVSSVELQEWQQIQSALQQLGAPPDSRLTLLEVITRRAERNGLRNVRTSLMGVDSLPQVPRASAPPVTIKVADYALLVEFTGSFAATRTFLATLPPTVGVQRISISRSGAGIGTRAILTVYEGVANAPI
jgi:hypothetical protein